MFPGTPVDPEIRSHYVLDVGKKNIYRIQVFTNSARTGNIFIDLSAYRRLAGK